MFGTSSDFEEKYMMDEPVVLVTVQYRLGLFAFPFLHDLCLIA